MSLLIISRLLIIFLNAEQALRQSSGRRILLCCAFCGLVAADTVGTDIPAQHKRLECLWLAARI